MEIPKYIDVVNYRGKKDFFLKKNYPEFFNYLNKEYPNVSCIKEKLYLFYFNLTEPPKCIVCGKKSIFFDIKRGYSEYCSNECANKSTKRIEKIKKTCLERYGVNNGAKTETSKEKMKQTCLERYGVEFIGETEEQKKKSKQTKLEKYGDENWCNPNKTKQTKLERYGDENWCNTNKIKQTKLEKYGDENYVNPEKRKQTCLEKYNCTSYTQTQEFKDKSKQTCLEKYGTDAYQKTKEFSEIIRTKLDIIQQKIYQTKKKNNTFNSSLIEKQFEAYLKENNINYKTQYKSELYPFRCDFYFPDSDLYLEINAHWTHGGHPFDSTNKDDLLLLEQWKKKNTKYFDIAINTWTVRDVLKRETAKKNNLNYIEVFTNDINEIKII